MKKTYILISDTDDQDHVIAAFTTEEAARMSLGIIKNDGYPGSFRIEIREVDPTITKLYWWDCILNPKTNQVVDVYKRRVPLIQNIEHLNGEDNIVSYGCTREEAIKNAHNFRNRMLTTKK